MWGMHASHATSAPSPERRSDGPLQALIWGTPPPHWQAPQATRPLALDAAGRPLFEGVQNTPLLLCWSPLDPESVDPVDAIRSWLLTGQQRGPIFILSAAEAEEALEAFPALRALQGLYHWLAPDAPWPGGQRLTQAELEAATARVLRQALKSWRHDLSVLQRPDLLRWQTLARQLRQSPTLGPEHWGCLEGPLEPARALWHQRVQDWLEHFDSGLTPEQVHRGDTLWQAFQALDQALRWRTEVEAADENRDPQALFFRLRTLVRHWQGAQEAWRNLAEVLPDKVSQSEANRASDHDWSSQIRALVEAQPELQSAQELIQRAQALKKLMQTGPRPGAAPCKNSEQKLRQLLHNGVEQHLYTCAQLLQAWGPLLIEPLKRQSVPMSPADAEKITLHALTQAMSQFETRSPKAPPAHRAPPLGDVQTRDDAPSRYILILEDNLRWQQELRELIEAALPQIVEQHQGLKSLDWQIQIFGDWQSGAEFCQRHRNQVALLICDISMPQQAGDPPRRAVGIQGLQNLFQGYQREGLHLLVQSTPSWLLEDQLEIHRMGLKDVDYLLKTHLSDWAERIEAALQDYAQAQSQPPRFQLEHWLEEQPPRFRLNGVALELSHLSSALLACFCTIRRGSAQDFFQALKSRGYPQYSEAEDAQQEVSWKLESLQSETPLLRKYWQELLWVWRGHRKSQPESLSAAQLWSSFDRLMLESYPQLWLEVLQGPESVFHLLWQKHHPRAQASPEAYVQWLTHFLPAESAQATSNEKFSKIVYPLRQEIVQSMDSVGQKVIGSQLLLSHHHWAGHHSYQLAPQVRLSSGEAPQTEQHPLQVCIVEDDARYAQEIQEILASLASLYSFELQCQHIPHYEALDDLPDSFCPQLVVLDLHLPRGAAQNSPAEADMGYRIVKRLRQRMQAHAHYRIVVSSSLVDDDELRVQGQALEIPLRNFVPKNRACQGVSWPESLQLKLQRTLKELQMKQWLPEQADLLPAAFPLDITLRYWDGTHLSLDVRAHNGEVQNVSHSRKRAEILVLMLKSFVQHPHVPVNQSRWIRKLKDRPPYHRVHNLLHRIRREEINAKWPVQGLQLGKNPAQKILTQHTLGADSWIQLRVRRVRDPEGFL